MLVWIITRSQSHEGAFKVQSTRLYSVTQGTTNSTQRAEVYMQLRDGGRRRAGQGNNEDGAGSTAISVMLQPIQGDEQSTTATSSPRGRRSGYRKQPLRGDDYSPDDACGTDISGKYKTGTEQAITSTWRRGRGNSDDKGSARPTRGPCTGPRWQRRTGSRRRQSGSTRRRPSGWCRGRRGSRRCRGA